MEIVIATPSRGGVQTGNRCTSEAWAELLQSLGHQVRITTDFDGKPADLIIALHGTRSHGALVEYQAAFPDAKRLVALAGTDLYPSPGPETLDSMRRADRVVALQSAAIRLVPEAFRSKLKVIVQGAARSAHAGEPRGRDPFLVAVVGHLRSIKDPMRTALAVRNLPAESRIRVRHAGAILDRDYEETVRREMEKNPRYEWTGELPGAEVEKLLVQSQLLVLSSFSEGGARVIGESLQCGTPVIAARNEAAEALLGEEYPGLYPAGETAALNQLLCRAESEPGFLEDLRRQAEKLASQFDPEREREAWRSLLAELRLEAENG